MKSFFAAFEVLLTVGCVMTITGCQSMSENAKKFSDDLGTKVFQAHALISVTKVTPSDPASNYAPSGKQITVIGDMKSIPLVTKEGEMVKDYAEYRRTKTPAWYNSANVTEEETFIGTGDNAKEVVAFFKTKREQANSGKINQSVDVIKISKSSE